MYPHLKKYKFIDLDIEKLSNLIKKYLIEMHYNVLDLYCFFDPVINNKKNIIINVRLQY